MTQQRGDQPGCRQSPKEAVSLNQECAGAPARRRDGRDKPSRTAAGDDYISICYHSDVS
jgi:hypothetical protein